MIKRILFPIAGAPLGEAPVRQAVELGLRHEARITALVAVDEAAGQRLAALGAVANVAEQGMRLYGIHRQVQEATAELRSACERAGVTHTVQEIEGGLHEAICEAWRYHDVTVIGMKSGCHPAVSSEPEDTVPQLLRHGVRPIITVPRAYRPVERVLVGYSGTCASAKALKRFVQLRLWPEAAVRIVHVAGEAEESERLLADAAAYCRDWGVEAETALRSGVPGGTLLREADEFDADLIVLGQSAHNVVRRTLFGDVMLHVLRNGDRALFLAQ